MSDYNRPAVKEEERKALWESFDSAVGLLNAQRGKEGYKAAVESFSLKMSLMWDLANETLQGDLAYKMGETVKAEASSILTAPDVNSIAALTEGTAKLVQAFRFSVGHKIAHTTDELVSHLKTVALALVNDAEKKGPGLEFKARVSSATELRSKAWDLK